ncbi:MAG: hypothetical protein L3J39_02545 [Verrucomicrobiales bacterium]|nr:hypothetical protein [Verrucomicrobiales bacterium]
MQASHSCHLTRTHPALSTLALPCCLLLTCLSLYFSLATLHAVDQKTPANGDDWLTFYYRNPRPDQLIAQLKAWSDEGTLQDSNARAPLLGFLSQVFHQNPQQLQQWYQQTQTLPAKDQELITMALWMCDSEESNALLKKELPKAFAGKKPPKILKLKLDSPSTLDLLWGYYFATGERKALRRIIAMFRYADAPKTLEGIPAGRSPLYTTLPHAAKWSISSNAKQHAKVLADGKELLLSDQLNATEKKWLDESLQQAQSPKP